MSVMAGGTPRLVSRLLMARARLSSGVSGNSVTPAGAASDGSVLAGDGSTAGQLLGSTGESVIADCVAGSAGSTVTCTAWCDTCLVYMTAAPEKLSASSWSHALWALVKLKHKPSR
jgi:hypothetical protein